MPSSIEELSEVLKVSYRHLEIYLKYLKEFQKNTKLIKNLFLIWILMTLNNIPFNY